MEVVPRWLQCRSLDYGSDHSRGPFGNFPFLEQECRPTPIFEDSRAIVRMDGRFSEQVVIVSVDVGACHRRSIMAPTAAVQADGCPLRLAEVLADAHIGQQRFWYGPHDGS